MPLKVGLLFQAEDCEIACKLFVAHKNVTKLTVKYDSHEDINLRPISSTTVRWYSPICPIWLLGNQSYVYWWWTHSQAIGIDQDGKLVAYCYRCVRGWYGQVVRNEDNKQASIKCIIYTKSSFSFEDVVINTKIRMQLETKKYLKIQNLFEMYGQWKLERQTFAHHSKQNLPLDSHSV